ACRHTRGLQARRLRATKELSVLDPVWRTRSSVAAGHRRQWDSQHRYQGHRRRRREIPGRRNDDSGFYGHQLSNVYDTKHRRELKTPETDLRAHAGLLFFESVRFALSRHDHAGDLCADEYKPARGELLELCAVSARRRTGDEILSAALFESKDEDSVEPTGRLAATVAGNDAVEH